MNPLPNSFVWAAASVNDEPCTMLESWRALEITRPATGIEANVHLVGQLCDGSEGRVSSAVRSVDGATRLVTTKSSRKYCLVGPPGQSSDGEYVLERWLQVAKGSVVRDVSDELFVVFEQKATP